MQSGIPKQSAWSIAFIICTAWISVRGQMETTAVLDTRSVTVHAEVGSQAKLPCPITNPDEIEVTWFIKSDPVKIDDVTTVLSRTGPDAYSLILNNVSYENQAVYYCMLGAFPPSYKEVTLKIEGAPIINRASIKDTYALNEGQEFQVSCETFGYPEPSIAWYVYKDPSNEGGEVKDLITLTKTLRIPRISRNDAGIFRCEATNKFGSVMFETLVEVKFKPNITVKPEVIKVQEGQSVSAVCVVESNPKSKVFWTCAQDPSSTRFATRPRTENDHYIQEIVFEIQNVTMKDKGIYKCLAKNDLGYTEKILQLAVQSTTKTDGSNGNGEIVPINQTTGINNTNVPDKHTFTIYTKEGTEAKLPCPITNPNGMEVNWYFNGLTYEVKIDNVTKSMSMEGKDAYSLILHTVRAEDVGKYLCVPHKPPHSHKVPHSIIEVILIIGRDESTTEDGPQAGSSKDKNTASVFYPSFIFLGVITLLTLLVEGV